MRFNEYVTRKNSEVKKQQIHRIASIFLDLFVTSRSLGYIKPKLIEQVKAHDNTENIWKNQDSPIFSWLKSHNIDAIPGVVPPFAQGGSGRAYFLDRFVVKMSTNRVEANVADMIKNRMDLPSPVIDVIYLENNIYGILQHFVNTDVPLEIKKAADYLTLIVDNYPEMDGYPIKTQEQEKICLEILKNKGGSITLLPYMLMILRVLIRLYQATGFKHTDAGPTNIALHQNKIVFHDLGPNTNSKYDDLESLVALGKNRSKLGLPKRSPI